MLDLARGWELDVERGPDWLFIKVKTPLPDMLEGEPLADLVWSLLEEHFTYRLVLELDEVERLDEHLVEQLDLLRQRLEEHNGKVRLCGLSSANAKVLRRYERHDLLPVYGDREEAVFGFHRPRSPR